MDLDKLRAEMADCECGHKHDFDLEGLYIGSGVINDVGAILKKHDFPRRILMAADGNSFRVTAGLYERLLGDGFTVELRVYDDMKVADMREVEELEKLLAWADAVAVGPGIGMEKQKLDILTYVLEHADIPVILDADALNLTARYQLSLSDYSVSLAVTPHLGEMARLCSTDISNIASDLISSAEEFARSQNVICVLKDAGTVVSNGNETYINTSGNSGMATAGSGDVLAGIFVGLTAQGMDLFEAAKLAVFLHGRAGDQAALRYGKRSMTSADLIDGLVFILAGSEDKVM